MKHDNVKLVFCFLIQILHNFLPRWTIIYSHCQSNAMYYLKSLKIFWGSFTKSADMLLHVGLDFGQSSPNDRNGIANVLFYFFSNLLQK